MALLQPELTIAKMGDEVHGGMLDIVAHALTRICQHFAEKAVML